MRQINRNVFIEGNLEILLSDKNLKTIRSCVRSVRPHQILRSTLSVRLGEDDESSPCHHLRLPASTVWWPPVLTPPSCQPQSASPSSSPAWASSSRAWAWPRWSTPTWRPGTTALSFPSSGLSRSGARSSSGIFLIFSEILRRPPLLPSVKD